MMKKSTTMKHLALALMVCVAQSVNAQELDPDLLNYVATGDTIGTEYVPDENYVPVTWEKKGLHAGMQMAQFILFTYRSPKAYEVPEYVEMYIRLKNCYGEVVGEKSDDASTVLDYMAFQDVVFNVLNLKSFIERGGEYVFERGIPWLGIAKSDDLVLVDEPSVRMNDFHQLKTGSNLNGYVLFNTGYPYERSHLTGKEKTEWTLQYMAPGSTERVTIDQGEMALTLDNSKQPRLAAIDTLKIFKEKPAMGEYFLEVKTDWEKEALGAMSDRNTKFMVVDTLRANATIDKDKYQLGVDKQLVVNLSLDYGYPFIHTTAPDTEPTVRIRYQITAKGDELFKDSLKIADQKLAVEPLKRNDQLVMNFDKVTDDLFGDADQMPISVHVTVEYDGNIQYTADFQPTLLKASDVGIRESQVADKKSSGNMYDVQGRRVATKPANGIYIQDGKKVIIK